jgi:cytochrome c oxidase cbb3-type subunit 3
MGFFVLAIVASNVLGALWLLVYASRRKPGEAMQGETTGHTWDGDLTELNNPMPRWWLVLFVGTVFFSVVYLLLYPGSAVFGGVLGWSQVTQYDAEVAAQKAREGQIFAQFAGRDVAALAGDPAALASGGRLFASNCSTCHGADGRGAPGFPNLTDDDWLWGGSDADIVASITSGRTGVMAPYAAVVGDNGVAELAAHVLSLSGSLPAGQEAIAARGGERFATLCAACHGADGGGNPALGAPNLTDGTWLHGGSAEAIARTIANGRTGVMPAHGVLLGEQRVRLVAAFVRSLGGGR